MSHNHRTAELTERRDDIIAAYRDGDSIMTLAQRYGVSSSPIRRLLHLWGVAVRPKVREKVLKQRAGEVERYYRAGMNFRELAAQFAVDRNTVANFIRARGVSRRTWLNRRTFTIKREADKGMLAGLLLGEGSIVRRGTQVAIRIVNTDRDIIEWCQQWGGRVYWYGPRPRGKKPLGTWDLAGAVNVFHCLTSIIPYMVGQKRALAEEALRWLEEHWGFEATDATPAHQEVGHQNSA